jgi:hypothetical protein
MAALTQFLELMRPHWSWLALVATWVAIGYVAVRRRMQWRRKTFLSQVNFSLNYAVGPHLVMRTLLETTAVRVWPNEHGVKAVLAAAARTTVDNPFVLLKFARDRDFVNRAVLNALSERFADVFLAAALGAPVRTGAFVFAVTCEKFDVMRTIKLRVILVEENTLVELFGPAGAADRLEIKNEIYRARLTTLRALYGIHVKDRASAQPVLGRVELGVVLPGGEGGAANAVAPCVSSASASA